jgi:AraC-like DNA-binding protein
MIDETGAGCPSPRADGVAFGAGLPLCYLRLLTVPAAARGVDTEAMLRRAGLAPLQLAAPFHPVPPSQVGRALRGLRRATRDDLLGLGERPLRLGTFVLVVRQMLQASTLGEGLRLGCSLYRALWPECSLRLRQEGAQAVLDVVDAQSERPWRNTSHLFLLHAAAGLMSWMTQCAIPLSSATLPALPGCAGAPSLFNPPTQVGRAGQLRFEARWLEQRVVADLKGLRAFLHFWPLGRLPPYRSDQPVQVQVRQFLRSVDLDRLPTLPELARAMGWTPKALRRQLSEEGGSWRAIVESLRCESAMRLLDRPELTVAEIGYRLGFSEPSAFHRAFKRASGQTPLEYRRHRGRAYCAL